MNMSNLSNYFEEIYCINLDKEVERWQEIQHEFKKLNIENKVIKFKAVCDSVRGRGACLSHLQLLKMAQQKQLKNVFIFEDDTRFIDWDEEYLNNAIEHLPSDWQIFNIGYNICSKESDFKFHRISENLIKIERGIDIRSNNAYAVNHTAFEYIIQEYDQFLNKWKDHQFKWHLDLWYAQNFTRYCLVPLMSVQQQGDKPQRFMNNFNKHDLTSENQVGSGHYSNPI